MFFVNPYESRAVRKFMERKGWSAVLVLVAVGGAVALAFGDHLRPKPEHKLVKCWAFDDPMFKGECFDFATFGEENLCEFTADRLNESKRAEGGGRFFGYGDYSFKCK
jgi:hypothetical protein